MKKILYFLFAFFAIFISSCTNDDIEIIETGRLTLNVSTQGVYDDFGISERFKTDFLSGSYNIGVYTFVYDSEGNLAASDSIYTQTFGNVSLRMPSLKNGGYTIIALEMLVDASQNYESDSWVIVGKEKLSTLEIVNKNYVAYWYSAVGLSVSQQEIGAADKTINLTPKGIGALIHTRISNFDKSNFKYVAFFTKDQPKGRFLSPSYNGEERFHYVGYNEDHVWSPRGYSLKTETLDPMESPFIYILEEGVLKYCFGAMKVDDSGELINRFTSYPSDMEKFSVKDGQNYYGGFHFVNDEECEACLVSTEKEYLDWYKQISVTISQDAEPYMVWGASATTVNSYMQKKGMTFLEDGMNKDKTLYYMAYSNPKNTLNYEYRFDTSKTNLNNLLMTYSSSVYSFDEVLASLKKDFTYKGYDESLGGYYFESSKTLALMIKDDNSFRVLYVANSASNSKALKKIATKAIKK